MLHQGLARGMSSHIFCVSKGLIPSPLVIFTKEYNSQRSCLLYPGECPVRKLLKSNQGYISADIVKLLSFPRGAVGIYLKLFVYMCVKIAYEYFEILF